MSMLLRAGCPAMLMAFGLAIAPALAPAVAMSMPARCAAPAELVRLPLPLSRMAVRLAAREPVVVVAIGSSSTAGAGATALSASYPSRLQALLAARFPGQSVQVLNKGVGGEDASMMLRRFDRDVLAYRPDLVIWQVGTNALIQDEDLERYGQAIRTGVQLLRAAGIDLVIMDLQYSPRILRQPRLEDMLDRIERVAGEMHIPVFQRFEIMHHWISSGQFTFADMLSPDRLHMNDASYDCIARLLADAVAGTSAQHAQKENSGSGDHP